jgi:hypothetical protein
MFRTFLSGAVCAIDPFKTKTLQFGPNELTLAVRGGAMNPKWSSIARPIARPTSR